MELEEKKHYNEEILMSLFENDNYMLWLSKETENSYVVDMIDDIHCADIDEQIKRDLLKYFYQGIKNYASHNNINPTDNTLDGYYTIKYNEHNYDIGKVTNGLQEIHYCRKNSSLDNIGIDFEDIKNNKELTIIEKKQNLYKSI